MLHSRIIVFRGCPELLGILLGHMFGCLDVLRSHQAFPGASCITFATTHVLIFSQILRNTSEQQSEQQNQMPCQQSQVRWQPNPCHAFCLGGLFGVCRPMTQTCGMEHGVICRFDLRSAVLVDNKV